MSVGGEFALEIDSRGRFSVGVRAARDGAAIARVLEDEFIERTEKAPELSLVKFSESVASASEPPELQEIDSFRASFTDLSTEHPGALDREIVDKERVGDEREEAGAVVGYDA